jgi:hypothetical protein
MTSVVGRSGQYWSAFSPSNVPGLALWYDFSDTSTFDLSGDYVITRVRDKSGNGYHGRPTGHATARWLYDGSISGALRFPERVLVNLTLDICLNAMNRFYSMATAYIGSIRSGFTDIVSSTDPNGPYFRFIGTQYQTGYQTAFINTPSNSVDSMSTSVGSFVGGYRAGVVGNGLITVLSGNQPGPLIGPSVGLKIGNIAANVFNNGLYHELLIYSNAISDYDRAAIEEYLIRKWMNPLTTTITAPTDIPGCVLWLDTSGTPSNNFTFATGSNVVKWNDKSGNGYDVSTVGTTTYPLWTRTDTSGLYFLPGATMNTSAPLPPTGEETAFIVGIKVGNASVRSLVTATAGSTGASRNIVSFSGSNISYRQNNGSAINSNIVSYTEAIISTTVPQLVMWRSKGGEITAKISGQMTSYATNWSNTTNTVGFTTIGPAAHCFLELVTYNRALSVPEVSNLEGYFFNKWGLSNVKTFTNLNSNRPFSAYPAFSRSFQVPHDIKGCMLWLDAKDSNTIELGLSNNVLRWYDKSGFQNDMSASFPAVSPAAAGPFYSNETVTFSNNRMTVRNPTMSASNFRMNPGVIAFDHTLIALHKPLTVTGNNEGNTGLFDFTLGTSNISFPTVTGTTPRGWTWSTTGVDRNTSPMLDNSVTTDYNIISASVSSLRQTVYRNGFVQKDLCGVSIGNFTFNTNATVSSIGRWGSNNSNFYQGDVKELFVFDRALGRYEINQIEGYLALKWNLTNLLPSDHIVFGKMPAVTTSFSPTASVEASVWLDATTFGSNYSDGEIITTNWTNLGSNASIAIVPSGTPTYRSNAYAGRPGIDMTGGTFAATTGLNLSLYYHQTFIVASYDVGSSGNRYAVTYRATIPSAPAHRVLAIGTDGSLNSEVLSSGGGRVGIVNIAPPSAGAPFLIEIGGRDTDIGISLNGNTISNTTAFTSIGSAAYNLLFIGRDHSNTTAAWPGKIHEIIAFDVNPRFVNSTIPGYVSEYVRFKTRAYLANKWGIANLLPTYSPHKGTRI